MMTAQWCAGFFSSSLEIIGFLDLALKIIILRSVPQQLIIVIVLVIRFRAKTTAILIRSFNRFDAKIICSFECFHIEIAAVFRIILLLIFGFGI